MCFFNMADHARMRLIQTGFFSPFPFIFAQRHESAGLPALPAWVSLGGRGWHFASTFPQNLNGPVRKILRSFDQVNQSISVVSHFRVYTKSMLYCTAVLGLLRWRGTTINALPGTIPGKRSIHPVSKQKWCRIIGYSLGISEHSPINILNKPKLDRAKLITFITALLECVSPEGRPSVRLSCRIQWPGQENPVVSRSVYSITFVPRWCLCNAVLYALG